MANKIFGVGAALMDILARVDDAFLKQQGSDKGGMTLVELEASEKLIESIIDDKSLVAGGSACNTLVGVSKLGGESSFVGMVGDDNLGKAFQKSIEENGVQSHLYKSETPTGRVVSLITPDAERTMFTYLGASAEIKPEDLKGAKFQESAIIHIEGYLAFNEPVFRYVLELAKAAGAKVSLDLASFEVVRFKEELLREVIPKYIDILIANEDEAEEYVKGKFSEEKTLEILSSDVDIAVLKLGADGSHINDRGEIHKVTALKVNAIDTTGAGDLWAAGYLYGLNQGWTQTKSANLGSIVAAEVVQVVGASIPEERWKSIHKAMSSL